MWHAHKVLFVGSITKALESFGIGHNSLTLKKLGSKRLLGTLFSQYGYNPTKGTPSDADILRFH